MIDLEPHVQLQVFSLKVQCLVPVLDMCTAMVLGSYI